MSSEPIRDPETDHLLTPANAALVVIDYQPVQVASIRSMDREALVKNVVTVVKVAKAYGLPIVLSTVNVKTGVNKPTVAPLAEALGDVPSLDRTTINSWEDVEVRAAIEATGRRKLILCALWTEACLLFPSLDVMALGYEVFVPVDAVGGTSSLAHEAALRRVEQAGARLTSIASLLCELQRDWARKDTVPSFADLLFHRHLGLA
ncbi:MAG TPA: isochorismatase family protein [Kofleriaceae bacterium]|nr:isochorismatase family protein [Kofleriaceae bacterium]